jgi:histidine ammonia-lyase
VLELHGDQLTLDDVDAFLSGRHAQVRLSAKAADNVRKSRAAIESILARGDVVYGINTGFGKLASKRIDAADLTRLQRNLLVSHAVGVGDPLPLEVTRLAMLLRVNALARGHSGIRLSVVERLLEFINVGITPVIPEKGSVGASGDLAPLAHMAIVLIGEGEAFVDGMRMSAKDALAKRGLAPMSLEAKEGLALINGTPISTAIGAAAFVRAQKLAKLADIACGMSLEALKGSIRPFDARVGALRPHPGHIETAANMRALLQESEILESHKNCGKVQDQYSLRCVPQVHGASRDALRHVGEVLARELNAVTDNPLVFPDDGDVVSAGNFHAQPVALVMDYAAIAVAEFANISERRLENLVNPDLSGLPPFLTKDAGLNSGFMIPQVTAAALVSENKVLCHPASVDSIPTSANKEDHVSMAPIAARKFADVVENAMWVLAIEMLTASQALSFNPKTKAGIGIEAARKMIGAAVPPMDEDRLLKPDMDAVKKMLDDGSLLATVTAACPEIT